MTIMKEEKNEKEVKEEKKEGAEGEEQTEESEEKEEQEGEEEIKEESTKTKLIKKARKVAKETGTDVDIYAWKPKTRLGLLVRDSALGLLPPEKAVDDMEKVFDTGLPIKEPEIVDILLPNLDDEVLFVNMVQRMTDSGRRVKFSVSVVVGNNDGFVGLGTTKGKEVGPTIRKAIDIAKLNIIPVKRGCGSWECGCGNPHSIPFAVKGKCGSVEVVLKPAPLGIGLACSDVAKHVLRMGGVKDVWSFARGQTRTTMNFAGAIFDAVKHTMLMHTTEKTEKRLNIKRGKIGV